MRSPRASSRASLASRADRHAGRPRLLLHPGNVPLPRRRDWTATMRAAMIARAGWAEPLGRCGRESRGSCSRTSRRNPRAPNVWRPSDAGGWAPRRSGRGPSTGAVPPDAGKRGAAEERRRAATALMVGSREESAGHVEQADRGTVCLVPGLDGAGCGHEVGVALLPREVVSRLV